MSPLFTLSPAAQQHMAQALQSSDYTRPVWYMGLKEIGCSGWQNDIQIRNHDASLHTEHHQAVIIQCQLDHRTFFMNTLIDYQSLGLGQHKLVLNNPQAESPCGCGDSFALMTGVQDG